MRTLKEIAEARALIERMIGKRRNLKDSERTRYVKTSIDDKVSPQTLRSQLQVLDWIANNKLDPFQVRLLAARAESERPYRDGEI